MATAFKMVTGYTGKQDRTPSDDASLNASILGKSEYVLDYGNKLSATIISANEIQLSDGIVLMQGKELRIVTGDTISATINNGETGYYRRDLIVAEYSKGSDELESCIIKTIEGTPSSTDSGAIVPSHTIGDIESGATANQMPLYVVLLNGLSVSSVTPQFAIMGLHTIAVTQTGTDLNDYTIDGKLYFDYNSHPTNAPVGAGAGGWLEVITTDGNNIKQIWHNRSADMQKTFTRIKLLNSWSAWIEIASKPQTLWTNPSPSSSFAEQTIAIQGLSSIDEIEIQFNDGTDGFTHIQRFIGSGKLMGIGGSTFPNELWSRKFTVSNLGSMANVKFDSAYYQSFNESTGTNNGRLIPLEISVIRKLG